jgi:hypothetical protein
VLAYTTVPRAALEPVEPHAAGDTLPGLPPDSLQQAPLLWMDPLVGLEPFEAAPSRSAPPPEGLRVRALIGQHHGVDLTDVPLDRSPRGASETHRLQARAFTSDRAVVIPPDAGSLETGSGAALLAHELTHVAQRARFGPNLPPEFSPAGRLMEAEALSAELALAPAPASQLDWPPAPSRPSGAGRAGDRVPGMPLAAAATSGPDVDTLAASIMSRMSTLSTPAAFAGTTEVFTSQWSASPAPAPAPPVAVQRADPLPEPQLAPTPAQTGSTPDGQAGPFSNRPSDQELNNLSRWLYPLLKYRLKGELREDRERAGLLTDHYRKW